MQNTSKLLPKYVDVTVFFFPMFSAESMPEREMHHFHETLPVQRWDSRKLLRVLYNKVFEAELSLMTKIKSLFCARI